MRRHIVANRVHSFVWRLGPRRAVADVIAPVGCPGAWAFLSGKAYKRAPFASLSTGFWEQPGVSWDLLSLRRDDRSDQSSEHTGARGAANGIRFPPIAAAAAVGPPWSEQCAQSCLGAHCLLSESIQATSVHPPFALAWGVTWDG